MLRHDVLSHKQHCRADAGLSSSIYDPDTSGSLERRHPLKANLTAMLVGQPLFRTSQIHHGHLVGSSKVTMPQSITRHAQVASQQLLQFKATGGFAPGAGSTTPRRQQTSESPVCQKGKRQKSPATFTSGRITQFAAAAVRAASCK
jgi:hypothetical protein